jgi:Family of unknown function (DUF5762)
MKFWLDEPTILFNYEYITELWPYSSMDLNQKMNAITRLVIILTLFGFMIFNHHIIFILGLIFVSLIVYLHYSQPNNKEGMANYYDLKDIKPIDDRNPLGNVLMSDYKYNPYKTQFNPQYNPIVEKNINDTAKNIILQQNSDNKDAPKLFSNLVDEFKFEQSMQRFHSNPVTTVDQKNEYGDFLGFIYGTLPSDKPLMIY